MIEAATNKESAAPLHTNAPKQFGGLVRGIILVRKKLIPSSLQIQPNKRLLFLAERVTIYEFSEEEKKSGIHLI